MKIGITGHCNIEKCHNENDSNTFIYNKIAYEKTFNEIETEVLNYIKEKEIQDVTFISGLARGVDEIFALIAIKHNFKLILCIPKEIEWYKNKTVNDLKIQALEFEKIVNYKKVIKIVESNDNYGKGNYGYFLKRNEDIVTESDVIFSYKKYESTGTNDCIQRAIKQNKFLKNI